MPVIGHGTIQIKRVLMMKPYPNKDVELVTFISKFILCTQNHFDFMYKISQHYAIVYIDIHVINNIE